MSRSSKDTWPSLFDTLQSELKQSEILTNASRKENLAVALVSSGNTLGPMPWSLKRQEARKPPPLALLPPLGTQPKAQRLYFWGSKITADGDCSHEIKRNLLLGRKIMTNLDSLSQLISNASRVMLKILQARLQQYVNCELPDVQAGFRKGRETRDQIANIHWIMEKAREFQENIYFCFIDYAKAFDCVDHNKLWKNSERDGNTRPPDLPPEKPICRSGSNSENWTWNNRLVPNKKKSTSRLCIVTLLI